MKDPTLYDTVRHGMSDLEVEPTTSESSLAQSRNLWAVLLAGGDGIRLRDLTRQIAGDSRPKQFCCILGGESLFRQTRTRLEPLFRRDRKVLLVSRAHEPYYREDLADTGGCCVIEQPLNRGTGIAMAVATVHVLLRDPDAIVGFFPCDHYYTDNNSFRSTVQLAAVCAKRHPESIILVGAKAEYPEVEYGWIEPSAAVLDRGARSLYRVSRFWEKPPLYRASVLMRQGCLWNTFVAKGRASAYLDVLCSEFPEIVLAVTRALADGDFELAYPRLPTVDFSRDVLAHQADRLLVLRDQTSGWADLGSPDRVLATLVRNGINPQWAAEQDGAHIQYQAALGLRHSRGITLLCSGKVTHGTGTF